MVIDIKSKKQIKNIPLLAVVVLSFIAIIYVIKSNAKQTYIPTQPISNDIKQTKIYKSKTLKFSISIPSTFQIEERFTTILLKVNNEEVQINRNGTNFDNIEGYLNDLSKKNKITIQDERKMVINGLNGIIGMIQYPGGPQNGEKIYYLYNNYAIYSLSTSSQALFSDLDKIAKSFRYTP